MLQRCETENAALRLQRTALEKSDNPLLVAEMTGIDWKVIVAKEFHYHKSCFRNYTRAEKVRPSARTADEQILLLKDYIEEQVVKKGMVISMSELVDMFEKNLQDDQSSMHPKTLRLKIKDLFGERINFWCPRYGSYFIYSSEIPVGQIIEAGKRRIEDSHKESQDRPLLTKVTEVAHLLRNEILDAPATYPNWPPTEDEVIGVETVLPLALSTFLKALLTSKSKLSSKKECLVSSIGQDIMYAVGNGDTKTSKHVILSLCTKRKTGSKQVISWMNRLGHGISYHETCALETRLAIQQSKEQTLRSFVPNIMQPSTFVTFVWDNNDVNPETLTGVSMHLTNGIMIQHASSSEVRSSGEEVLETPPRPSSKPRSFKAVTNVLGPYISKKRAQPSPIENLALLEESFEEVLSKKIDFWWSILRCNAQLCDVIQTVPNWTGFNYLISETSMSFQQVCCP